MTHSSNHHSSRRRRLRPWHWFKPRGSRTLALGICAAVGGLAGSARGAVDGMEILKVLGLLGIGILGVLLTIGYIVNYAKER
ncbi:hypothetical protein ACFQ7N_02005 [Streptomyces niveus]|uniref:hypothetical protein n=1 Tax=Streptomyces niveus TaxID=193462 RepID=UPI0036A98161